MKWKFFGVRKRREWTFIHNLCPLCGRRRGASSADRVGRSYGADRVVRPYTFCAERRGRCPLQTGKWLCPTLDKPAGMGIIINTRGRCDKRSAPLSENFNEPYGSQKPSLGRVAVFAFQSLDSYRDRMSQNMNRKHEKHTVTPLQKEVTDRLAMYTASLGCIISRSPVFVNSHRLTNPAGWI